MVTFDYTVTDPVGIHARPAGDLVKKVKEYSGVTVKLIKGEKSAELTKLMMVMSLGVKCGETIKVSVEGENEDQIAAEIEQYFKDNL